jgi:hypothetical protein
MACSGAPPFRGPRCRARVGSIGGDNPRTDASELPKHVERRVHAYPVEPLNVVQSDEHISLTTELTGDLRHDAQVARLEVITDDLSNLWVDDNVRRKGRKDPQSRRVVQGRDTGRLHVAPVGHSREGIDNRVERRVVELLARMTCRVDDEAAAPRMSLRQCAQ